jgi:hypothetical protein
MEAIGMAVPGTERLIRETARDPTGTLMETATVGIPWYFESMAAEAQAHPQEFVGQLIGGALLGAGIGAVSTKIGGLIRTRGLEEIPIERFGYPPEYGFPISYRQTPESLIESFETGTLKPWPDRMSLSERVPYVPEMARLPGEEIGKPVLWTGWENTPVGRGGQFVLREGTSEIPGMYGAPVAESYFTKVGGQMPRIFGMDIRLLRTPSIVYTEVSSLEAISRSVRSGGFESLNRYIAEAEVGGRAYLPMMKPEYEAVLPAGNVLEILPRRYYTKLGGFGENHFLGTRVPIIETKAIGKIADVGAITEKVPSVAYEPYRPAPILNIPYGIPASVVASIERFRVQISTGSVTSLARTTALNTIEEYGSKLSALSGKMPYVGTPSAISQPYNYRPPSISGPSLAFPSSSQIQLPSYPSSRISVPSYLSLPSRISMPSYPSMPSRMYSPSYPTIPYGRYGPSYPSTPSRITIPSVPYVPPYIPPSVPYTPSFVPPVMTGIGSIPIWWERKPFRFRENLRVKFTEWWITNPVPSLESVFGASSFSLPSFGMPGFNFNW